MTNQPPLLISKVWCKWNYLIRPKCLMTTFTNLIWNYKEQKLLPSWNCSLKKPTTRQWLILPIFIILQHIQEDCRRENCICFWNFTYHLSEIRTTFNSSECRKQSASLNDWINQSVENAFWYTWLYVKKIFIYCSSKLWFIILIFYIYQNWVNKWFWITIDYNVLKKKI